MCFPEENVVTESSFKIFKKKKTVDDPPDYYTVVLTCTFEDSSMWLNEFTVCG